MTEGKRETLKLIFEPQAVYVEMAKLEKRELAPHEGYFRDNDGTWIAWDNREGNVRVSFRGNAKRGQGWNAPDPKGQQIMREIVRAVNSHSELVKALEAIKNGPWSQNCDYCCKTTKYSGKPRIESHKEDCPVALAEAALNAAGKGK